MLLVEWYRHWLLIHIITTWKTTTAVYSINAVFLQRKWQLLYAKYWNMKKLNSVEINYQRSRQLCSVNTSALYRFVALELGKRLLFFCPSNFHPVGWRLLLHRLQYSMHCTVVTQKEQALMLSYGMQLHHIWWYCRSFYSFHTNRLRRKSSPHTWIH